MLSPSRKRLPPAFGTPPEVTASLSLLKKKIRIKEAKQRKGSLLLQKTRSRSPGEPSLGEVLGESLPESPVVRDEMVLTHVSNAGSLTQVENGARKNDEGSGKDRADSRGGVVGGGGDEEVTESAGHGRQNADGGGVSEGSGKDGAGGDRQEGDGERKDQRKKGEGETEPSDEEILLWAEMEAAAEGGGPGGGEGDDKEDKETEVGQQESEETAIDEGGAESKDAEEKEEEAEAGHKLPKAEEGDNPAKSKKGAVTNPFAKIKRPGKWGLLKGRAKSIIKLSKLSPGQTLKAREKGDLQALAFIQELQKSLG